MDRPLSVPRGRKPQHQKKQRQKLKSAASAANRLVTKPQSRKDRKTALAAAARLFELAERNGTKIEFVGAEESDGEDIGMEEAMAEGGYKARDASLLTPRARIWNRRSSCKSPPTRRRTC
jgi:hypothetical protein